MGSICVQRDAFYKALPFNMNMTLPKTSELQVEILMVCLADIVKANQHKAVVSGSIQRKSILSLNVELFMQKEYLKKKQVTWNKVVYLIHDECVAG